MVFEETLLVTPELQEQWGLVSPEISRVIGFRAGKGQLKSEE